MPNRTLMRPETLCHSLVDNAHGMGAFIIGGGKRTTAEKRNSHGPEVLRADAAQPECRGLAGLELRPSFDVEKVAYGSPVHRQSTRNGSALQSGRCGGKFEHPLPVRGLLCPLRISSTRKSNPHCVQIGRTEAWI